MIEERENLDEARRVLSEADCLHDAAAVRAAYDRLAQRSPPNMHSATHWCCA